MCVSTVQYRACERAWAFQRHDDVSSQQCRLGWIVCVCIAMGPDGVRASLARSGPHAGNTRPDLLSFLVGKRQSEGYPLDLMRVPHYPPGAELAGAAISPHFICCITA